MEKTMGLDAVGMVRRIRDGHYEQTKAMSKEERLAFYRERGQQAQAELERLARQLSKRKA